MNFGRLSAMITRGKVQLARVAARTLMQVTGWDEETFQNVEMLLPPGYVANPLPGGDILLLQTNGVRGHVVAIAGDNTVDTVAGLQPGEIGLSRGGRTILLRLTGTHVVDPAEIVLQTPALYWSPDGVTMHLLATDAHTHGGVTPGANNTAPPNSATGMLT